MKAQSLLSPKLKKKRERSKVSLSKCHISQNISTFTTGILYHLGHTEYFHICCYQELIKIKVSQFNKYKSHKNGKASI